MKPDLGAVMSYKTRITFTIAEPDGGQPYLQMEFLDSIPGLPNDPPVFDLPPGTDMQRAEEIAAFLNSNLIAFRPFPSERKSGFQTTIR
jgi:hypothetical protein